MTPEEERAAVVRWLRDVVGAELVKIQLMAGLPGTTAYQRMKQRTQLEGMWIAVRIIREGIESGAHLSYGEPG